VAVALALLLPAAALAQEKLPAGLVVIKVEARPAVVLLKNPYDYRQLLLVGTTASGETVDVTRAAAIAAPALVKVSPTGLVRPAADGSGEIVCTVASTTVRVPVTVSGLKSSYPVSFVRDVMPTLSKMGCNAGT